MLMVGWFRAGHGGLVGDSVATNVQVNDFFNKLRNYDSQGNSNNWTDRRYAHHETIGKNFGKATKLQERRTRNSKNQTLIALSQERDHLLDS